MRACVKETVSVGVCVGFSVRVRNRGCVCRCRCERQRVCVGVCRVRISKQSSKLRPDALQEKMPPSFLDFAEYCSADVIQGGSVLFRGSQIMICVHIDEMCTLLCAL